MAWLFHKNTAIQSNVEESKIKDTEVHPYQAVKIKTGKCACKSARTQEENMYLCKEAPVLPLPACLCRESCLCHYQHFSDRRQKDRRIFVDATANLKNQDRRHASDRRNTAHTH